LIKTFADKIRWPIVVERAKRWGGQKGVYLMLLLVRELLGAAAPDEIMAEIKPEDYQSVFFDEALEQIFDIDLSDQLLRKRIGNILKIKKVKGMRGKVAALSKTAFPSREYLATIYPVSVSSPKIYLCYLFRLRRLMINYAIVLLRVFRREKSTLKAVQQEHRVSAVSDWVFSK
jgi:hypothetical protein